MSASRGVNHKWVQNALQCSSNRMREECATHLSGVKEGRSDDSHLDRYMRERRTFCALLAMDQKRWQQRVYEGLKRRAAS